MRGLRREQGAPGGVQRQSAAYAERFGCSGDRRGTTAQQLSSARHAIITTMDSQPSLKNPSAKHDRAGEHLQELVAELEQFISKDPHSVIWQTDPEAGWHQARFKVRLDPPLRLGLIFGDVIHNLRSALDNLVCQLALLGSGDCRRTQFPICSTPADFAHRRNTWLSGVDAEHVDRIESYQPYADRDEAAQRTLKAINTFDNLDKHRAIQPCVMAVNTDPDALAVRREPVEAQFAMEFQWITTDRPLHDGAVIARFHAWSAERQPKVTRLEFDLALRTGFGELGLNLEVVPILHRVVGLIINDFEPAFALY